MQFDSQIGVKFGLICNLANAAPFWRRLLLVSRSQTLTRVWLRETSLLRVGILYSSRLILLYSDHLESRQTVENHLVHTGTSSHRHTHTMTSQFPWQCEFCTRDN